MASTDVLIVGAGVAGLMYAMTTAGRGRHVWVFDHANKAGKKILMSGGGHCNFTNLYTEPTDFLSRNPHFCKSALVHYTQWDFTGLVAKHQVSYHEKKLGQLFCDNKSSDIFEMLLRECAEVGAEIPLDISIEEVVHDDAGYRLRTSAGEMRRESLVIVSGSLSIPTLGVSDFGYQVARQFGHEVLLIRAGLVPFTVTDQLKELCVEFSGTSVDCRVSCNGQVFRENLLFIHRGLSGSAMSQVSSYWQPGDASEIDLLPNHDASERLVQQQRERPSNKLKTLFAELFTKKLARLPADRWLISKPMKQYIPTELAGIAGQFSAWRVMPSGIEGYRTMEVTLGGVSTDEVSSKTMEPQCPPGSYFIDEVLDVSGYFGGFNFQWAWASGHAVG